MSVFNQIKNFLGRKESANEVPEGFCPNCWGRQEYEGQFFEAIHKERIDLNNIDQKKGWIEAYAARYLEGIQLNKEADETYVCPGCKVTFRPT